MIRKSPFSKITGSDSQDFGAGVDENGNKTWTDSFGVTVITEYADPTKQGKTGVGISDEDAAVNKAMRQLRTSGDKLTKQILNNPNLSEAEKRKWTANVLKTQKGENLTGFVQNSLQSTVVNPFKKYIGKPALQLSEDLIRGVQAGAVEFTEGVGQFFMPQTGGGQKIVLKSRDKNGEWVPVKASLDEFADKATDRSWAIGRDNWYNGGKADENLVVELASGIVFDPLTYMTMGASVSSKAGRLALSNRMVPLITKYPELKPLLGNIARYGPVEIPKHIREAENIFLGVKWFGKELPYTDSLAKAWRYTGGAARANVGDIVYGSKTGGAIERVFASKSMKPAIESGIFRAGAMNKFDKKWIVPLAEKSSATVARGHLEWMRRVIDSEAEPHLDLLDLAEKAGDPTIPSIVHAIETPALRAGLSGSAAEIADKYKLWQDMIYSRYGDAVQNLAKTRDLNINDLSMLEDYIYHQLTPAAREDIFGAGGKLKKFFDLTKNDVVEGAGPMQFRKYTAGEDFLGTVLEHGTVSEINKVYGDFLESKGLPRANFFEEDLRIITEGYANSVARAHSRLRFVENMFNYGPEVIKPLLIEKIIPDATLLASLRDDISKLTRIRNVLAMRVRVGIGTTKIKGDVATELREVIGLTTKALEGGFMSKQAADAELLSIVDELSDIIRKQEESRTFAMNLTAQQRGQWADAHTGILTEAHNLREAIINGSAERYSAGQRLKQMYFAEFPESDGSELVDKPVEWIAERISRAVNGGATVTSHEIPALRQTEARLVDMLQNTPKTSENIEKLRWIDQRLSDVREKIDAFDELDSIREGASYSDKGVLFGFAPVEGEPMPFQMWTTMAPYNDAGAFRQMDDALMRHAIPEEQLVDFRTTDHMLAVVDDPSTIYEFGYSWGRIGAPDLTWNSVVDDAMESGVVDDLMWQTNPEKAMLLDGFLQFRQVVEDAINEGVDLTDRQVEQFFNMIKDANYNVIASLDAGNADAVSRSVINEWFQSLINVADQEGFDGILVPAKAVFDDTPSSEWAVLQHASTPTPQVGTSFYDEVQFVKDNAMADSILDNTTEMSRLQLMDNADMLIQDGIEVETVQAARRELEDQLFGVERTIESQSLAKNIVEDMVTVDGKQYPAFVARNKMAKLEDQIEAAYKAIDDEVLATTEREFGVNAIEASAMDVTGRMLVAFDNVKALADWTPEFEQKIVDEIAGMVLHLQTIPDQGLSAGANAAWIRQTEQLLANSSMINDPAVRDAYDRVVKIMLADEVALAKIDSEIVDLNMEAAMVAMGWEGGRYVYESADKGWEALKSLGVQMPEEVLERWKPNIAKLQNQEEWQMFAKAMGRVQGYWKKYVTNTMGFLVRNGYSGTFMNYADGVTTNHIIEGTRWASAQGPILRGEKNWRKAGNSWGKWMEAAGIDLSNPAAVAEANKVMEIVYATSRGVNTDNAMPVVERWKVTKWMDKNKQTAKWRLGDNPYLNLFTSKNDFVERALRIPMALDSVRQGHTVEEAVARISRVHFDYSDLSSFDELAKKAIPFWVWTSRNVPLQVTQMMSRPKAYYEYNKIQQAFPTAEDDPSTPNVDEGAIIPKWIKAYGPLQIGKGSFLTPDLPHMRMKQQIENLFNPVKLIGQVNPIVRVPIEVFVSKRQLGLDVGNFKKNADVRGYEKYIWQLLRDLKMYGLIDRDEETGDYLMHAGVSYAIEQAAVPLQQINRLTGGRTGGKESLNERWASSVWNWFGIPYRGVGTQQEESELISRNFAVDKLSQELEKKLRIEKDYSSKP